VIGIMVVSGPLCTLGYSDQFSGVFAGVNRMAESQWMNDWRVQVRVWIEREGQAVLGEGRAELLAAIDRESSITRAAKSLGMSYRRGWSMVQSINAAANEPLVETAAGGIKGGGARLTPRGRLALEVYEQVRHSLVGSASSVLQRAVRTDSRPPTTLHVAAAISLQFQPSRPSWTGWTALDLSPRKVGALSLAMVWLRLEYLA
jgi:molybdate transport system regulatory protein